MYRTVDLAPRRSVQPLRSGVQRCVNLLPRIGSIQSAAIIRFAAEWRAAIMESVKRAYRRAS